MGVNPGNSHYPAGPAGSLCYSLQMKRGLVGQRLAVVMTDYLPRKVFLLKEICGYAVASSLGGVNKCFTEEKLFFYADEIG